MKTESTTRVSGVLGGIRRVLTEECSDLYLCSFWRDDFPDRKYETRDDLAAHKDVYQGIQDLIERGEADSEQITAHVNRKKLRLVE